jgi:hypothetical protein
MSGLEIFKEISIGGLTKEQLISQLTEKGVQFNKYANVLFEHPNFIPSDKPERVTLVTVKLQDLQLSNPCSFEQIVSKALNLGLKLCPLYLGAFLRLSYLDQPEGPYLTIASFEPEPKHEIDENYPNGFYLRNFESSLWLRGYRATGEPEWPLDNEFIFMK